MNWIGYMVIGIIIAILLVVYVLFVLIYLGASKGYREAERVNAVIKEDLGNLKMATGSVAIGVPKFRVFHKYNVSFWLEDKEYFEVAELKNCHLKVGDMAEVRYSISKKGKLVMESEALLCWSREMAIGYTLGLVLGIVLSILKVNGVIE